MKYSISYNSDISLRKAADEIRVPFNKLGYIYDFMTNYPEKRYVIIVDSILTNLRKMGNRNLEKFSLAEARFPLIFFS